MCSAWRDRPTGVLMLTLIIIAVFILFGVPAFLLLMARLLTSNTPRRSSGIIGFPVEAEPPEAPQIPENPSR